MTENPVYIFSNQEQKGSEDIGRLVEMPITELLPFREHTFQVKYDAKMVSLIESIKKNGVLEPIIAFKNEDGLMEQVTGHRRVYACKELDIATIPTIIKDLTRDQAIIIMGASNIERREEILPSEKAATYRLMLDALKRKRKSDGDGRADAELSEIVEESSRTIQRYIRLNYLNPELLKLTDEGRIGFNPAVELSYLSGASDVAVDSKTPDFQGEVFNFYIENNVTPSHAQAIKMHKLFKDNLLTVKDIETIMNEKKGNQKAKKIRLSDDFLRKFFKESDTEEYIEQTLIRAMQMYLEEKSINQEESAEKDL